jgi:hypothetical protein
VPLQDLLPLVPRLLHPVLRASRYATDRSQSLIIQSDESRKQAANVDSCYDKLYELLQSMANDVIPGETSPEQRDRVQKLCVDVDLFGWPIQFVSDSLTDSGHRTKPGSRTRNYTVARRVVDGGNMMINLDLNSPVQIQSDQRLIMCNKYPCSTTR